jgi:primosomal protein N'
MNFVQVAIPSPLRQTFTYINKSGSDLLGKRVLVEFGRRKLVGVVISNSDISEGGYKLKNILEVLDETPLFSKEAIKKITYISEYYMHPLGIVIESFIPTFLRKAKHQKDLEKYHQAKKELISATNLHKLTNDQANCLDSIKSKSEGEILLSGITSSGKTEVYKHFINSLIMKGKVLLCWYQKFFLLRKSFMTFNQVLATKYF